MRTEDGDARLAGGRQTVGLQRVGTRLHRPAHEGSDFVEQFLRDLRAAGFEGAPRHWGRDPQGREVLDYIEGTVPHGTPANLSDGQIASAAKLVLAFHSASAASSLRGSAEIVTHGDLGPHNTVFRGETAVGIIDWDANVGPGTRLSDFAHAVWCFADLTERTVPVAEQARRMRIMCEGYPGLGPADVLDDLGRRFTRAGAQHADAGRLAGVQIFADLHDWLRANRAQLLAN